MIRKLSLKDLDIVEQILKLQKAAYEIEANIIGFYDIPPLKDTTDSLKTCGEVFYGYYINNVLVGIVSFKIIGNILDIHRVAVDPSFFKNGIAEKLIGFIEELDANVNRFLVSTGKENFPAINLYIKMGYHKKRNIEICENIYLTELEKIRPYSRSEVKMSNREKFEGSKKEKLAENEIKYGKEIREKYGEETVVAHNNKFMGMSEDDFNRMQETENKMFQLLKDVVKTRDLESEAAQNVYKKHKSWLTYTWTHYTPEAHIGLAEMYVDNEDFSKYYNNRAGEEVVTILRDIIKKHAK